MRDARDARCGAREACKCVLCVSSAYQRSRGIAVASLSRAVGLSRASFNGGKQLILSSFPSVMVHFHFISFHRLSFIGCLPEKVEI